MTRSEPDRGRLVSAQDGVTFARAHLQLVDLDKRPPRVSADRGSPTPENVAHRGAHGLLRSRRSRGLPAQCFQSLGLANAAAFRVRVTLRSAADGAAADAVTLADGSARRA
jgi:hypothetical protein